MQKSSKIIKEFWRSSGKKTLVISTVLGFFFWNEPLPIHCPQPRSQRIVVCLRCFLPGRSTWEETLAIPSDNKAVDSAFDIIDHIKPLQILEDEIYNSKDFRKYLLQDIIRNWKKLIASHAGHCLPIWYSIRATPLQFACFLNQICLCCSLLTCHTRHWSCIDRGSITILHPKRDATVQYNVWEPLKIQFVPICSNGNVCMLHYYMLYRWVW